MESQTTQSIVHGAIDEPVVRPAAYVRDARWVLRRALLGVLLMVAISSTAAVLLNAGIDPTLEQASE